MLPLRIPFISRPTIPLARRRTAAPGIQLFTSVVAAFAMMPSTGCEDRPETPSLSVPAKRPESEIAITTFCGSCHVFPPPSSFPRSRWRHEVQQGLKIYADSGRTDLVPPDLEATVAWFEALAPESYVFQEPEETTSTGRRFRRVDAPGASTGTFPKIAHLRVLDAGRLIASEVYTGIVNQVSFVDTTPRRSPVIQVADPVHVEPTDLDDDGITDFVVADIGFINPSKQPFGTLWWARPRKGDDEDWEAIPLKTGFSRICDVRPMDHDQDGDQDLVIAEFGYIQEGSVQLLTNKGVDNGVPSFDYETLDDRSGASHVPVIDLNEDGMPDFVSLVSQEHETIDAYLNVGRGKFRRERIFAAADPAYASSGIELVDLDGDSDTDVLLTNGDTFDDHTPKPFHSVQWLENQGTYPFTHHHLTYMPGVYRAVAGDIDRDGDLDIAAVALISRRNQADEETLSEQHFDGPDAGEDEMVFDGAIWLEQTAPGEFARHRILGGQCEWSCCELIDVDEDDDLDLVLGRYLSGDQSTESIVLFENLTDETLTE